MTIKSAAAPGRTGGYSLLELLTTLAIAGTLALVAGPPLQDLVLNGRRTSAVNDLLLTLMLARSETVKRGKALVVCGIADTNGNGQVDPDEQRCAGHDWSAGWLVGTWHDADGDAFVDAGELTPVRVFNAPAPGLSITAGNFTATPPVGPHGTLLVRQFGWRTSNGTVTVCDRRGASHARAVIVSPIGRARASARRADGTPLRCPAD
jgi:type IV fimbrial biogenesis protein FimT